MEDNSRSVLICMQMIFTNWLVVLVVIMVVVDGLMGAMMMMAVVGAMGRPLHHHGRS